MKKSIVFLTLLLFISSPLWAQKSYNIRDYGAKGNGTHDDSKAIIACLQAAVKNNNSQVIIPYGRYRITQPIDLYYTDQSLTIKGISRQGKKPVIFSSQNFTLLSLRGYAFPDLSKGSATVENIRFIGSNPPYSSKHPFIQKSKFYYGIYIADKNKASINNVEVENVYGEGIGIISTDQQMAGNGRFHHVSVKNSSVINCWGFNPKIDDYGDGIYVANAKQGEIVNNKVHNNLAVTKQLGRAGIVLEWFADNILVSGNDVKGYDRGIHLEGTCGGQQIINNTLAGSDLGIVLYEYPRAGCSNKAIIIRGNTVSNAGFSKSFKVDRVRKPRSMINFLAKDNSRAGSIVEINSFTIDEKYQFEGSSFANILSDGVTFQGNSFTVIPLKNSLRTYIFNDLGKNNSIKNNTVKGVKINQK